MPTTNMVMTLPTEDGSSGIWDTLLHAALDIIDAHDHSTGKGVSVKTAGISINADLPFGGFSATGLKAADFTPVATSAVAALAAALFTNSADNELYWRTTAGVNVKLTAGTSLNAALLDGFTGDYGAGDEEANYSSGTSIYNFLRAANHRAFIDSSDIRLFEGTSGISNSVKLKSPASLAGSYTLTMPTALPGSTSLLMLSAAGVLSTSLAPSLASLALSAGLTVGTSVTIGTTLAVTGAATLSSTLGVTGAITASAALTVGTTLGVTGAATLSSTLAVTGAATLSSTLGVTGLITATAGLTAGANADVKVSGTGLFKHGNYAQMISPLDQQYPIEIASPGWSFSDSGSGTYMVSEDGATTLRIPLRPQTGWRIRSVNVDYFGGGAVAPVFSLYGAHIGNRTQVGVSWGTASNGVQVDEASASMDVAVDGSRHYFLLINPNNVGDRFGRIAVIYDIP